MKKIVKYGICGLAAMMLLAGCSKKADETTAVETTAESTEETTKAQTDTDTIDPGSVTLGEYKGLEVEGMSTEVTDEEIEAKIEDDLSQNLSYVEITDRPAQLGDVVNIDYVGLKDDVAFEGGTAQGQDLELGSNSYIGGFEEGLVGAKKGDEVTLNLTFPEDYGNAELAGQAVVFEVTVNSIEEMKLPELDETFVQTTTDFATVEEYRDNVRAELEANKEAQSQYMIESYALMGAIDNATFECNPDAIEAEYLSRRGVYDDTAAGYGISTEDLIAAYGMDMERFELELREMSEEVIKQKLIVEAIAEAEGLKVDDLARQKVADSESMSLDALIESYGQEAVDQVALTYKVVGFLAENAKVK